MTTPSAQLAIFAAALRFEDIPAPVVRRTEDLLVDWFGSAVALPCPLEWFGLPWDRFGLPDPLDRFGLPDPLEWFGLPEPLEWLARVV